MSPVQVAESVQIARPPAEVWEAIADYSFDLEWREGLQQMDPDPEGPAAAGTKVHEVVRTSGREYVADTVVTEFEPGISYRFEGEGTVGGLAGGRTVAPAADGEGAVFTYAVELEPRGMMRLLGPLLRRTVRANLRRDLQQLKTLLESRN